jgi:hypothetical protein
MCVSTECVGKFPCTEQRQGTPLGTLLDLELQLAKPLALAAMPNTCVLRAKSRT